MWTDERLGGKWHLQSVYCCVEWVIKPNSVKLSAWLFGSILLLCGVTDFVLFCCVLQQHRTGLAAKIWQSESNGDIEKWISERKRFSIYFSNFYCRVI